MPRYGFRRCCPWMSTNAQSFSNVTAGENKALRDVTSILSQVVERFLVFHALRQDFIVELMQHIDDVLHDNAAFRIALQLFDQEASSLTTSAGIWRK